MSFRRLLCLRPQQMYFLAFTCLRMLPAFLRTFFLTEQSNYIRLKMSKSIRLKAGKEE